MTFQDAPRLETERLILSNLRSTIFQRLWRAGARLK